MNSEERFAAALQRRRRELRDEIIAIDIKLKYHRSDSVNALKQIAALRAARMKKAAQYDRASRYITDVGGCPICYIESGAHMPLRSGANSCTHCGAKFDSDEPSAQHNARKSRVDSSTSSDAS
jgi:hypothetical protein